MVFLLSAVLLAQVETADLVVYGGTAGGAIASVAAAREGKKVILLEASSHIGGMTTGGLGATDVGNPHAIGGYAREFYDRVFAVYVRQYGANSIQAKEANTGFRFEPHVASTVLLEMLKEAKVDVRIGVALESASVDSVSRRILAIMAGGKDYRAAVYIDGSYEGDLMKAAGVAYTVGRESKSQYGESIAGVQEHSAAHQWPVKVSPFVQPNKLLPFVQNLPYDAAGTGDRKVQAYNYRLCLTKRADIRKPFPRPAGYDSAKYALLARYLAAKPGLKFGQLCNPVFVPNGKTDVNNNGAFSTDHIGANWDYPEANADKRRAIVEDHLAYTQGFFYFLANDPNVPKALQAEVNQWGLAGDEFTANGNWPPQLYVREARRMIGEYVMKQKDLMEDRTKEDSVGLGSYNTDSHHVQRLPTADGAVVNEGDFQVGVKPYAIPYRSLTPKATECANLLVPVCCSATHVAYGSIRMEPVYMILGQASGVAAALAIDRNSAVQQLPASELTTKLKSQKAVLDPTTIPSAAKGLDVAKLEGIVVDDEKAVATGPWHKSASLKGFVGSGYLHDNNENKGKCKIRFPVKLPEAGAYRVRLFYTPNANRATNVSVVIMGYAGATVTTIDEKKPTKNGAVDVGVFRFAADAESFVEIRNNGADGFVVADAVQFIPVGKKKGK